MKSDVNLDASKFQPGAISQKTASVNAKLVEATTGSPKWWNIGAPKFREMRRKGQTAFPAPVILPSGSEAYIPSREVGRQLRLRVHKPEMGRSQGVLLHIHGGGWVLQDEDGQDPLLHFIANSAQLTVVSVGYRLAPEHPFPAGPEDCYDAAEWLVDNASSHFGSELMFLGGESAGGHLSALTCLHLIKTRPKFEFKALLLTYGIYDLAQWLPQIYHFKTKIILNEEDMDHFLEAVLPGASAADRRDPSISPLFADLRVLAEQTPSGRLPSAFFTVGTMDPLVDDTVLLSSKWMMTGSEAVVKIYPGAPHAFSLFPPDALDASRDYRADLLEFLSKHVSISKQD